MPEPWNFPSSLKPYIPSPTSLQLYSGNKASECLWPAQLPAAGRNFSTTPSAGSHSSQPLKWGRGHVGDRTSFRFPLRHGNETWSLGSLFQVSEGCRNGKATALLPQLKISPNTGKEPRGLISPKPVVFWPYIWAKVPEKPPKARKRLSSLWAPPLHSLSNSVLMYLIYSI